MSCYVTFYRPDSTVGCAFGIFAAVVGSLTLARCCPVLCCPSAELHCIFYAAFSCMAPGAAPCQWITSRLIVMGALLVSATHDVSDHGAGPGEDATSEQCLTEQWNEAEATYGICRPGVDDGAVCLHRQTTERVAIGPEEWELIPVGHNMPPAVILEDIARVYRDIGDQWSALTWWLCRIHESSVLSAMPILGYANYVLVLENEYVNLGRRPHGLMELVCGDDSYLFPTVLPEWLNWPLLQAFLEPISHCNHFGMGMMGFYNGDRLSQRLVQCNSGFFVQVHYISTVFFLRELLHGARVLANTLHVTEVHPAARRVRRSAVFIAGGASLLASRYYETMDFHERRVIMGDLRNRFPDLTDKNFDLVPVHSSMSDIDPVASFVRQRFVLAPFEEEGEAALLVSVILKLDLPPYQKTGAIIVPPVLRKDNLVMQTGVYLICGPIGELCTCYHNGLELRSDRQVRVHQGDFFVCWLDTSVSRSPRVGIPLGLPSLPRAMNAVTSSDSCSSSSHASGQQQ